VDAAPGDRTTEAIAECKMLQVVRLSYCENLTSQALVNLATLPHAEVRPQPLQLSCYTLHDSCR
jgi:hypothetical protein